MIALIITTDGDVIHLNSVRKISYGNMDIKNFTNVLTNTCILDVELKTGEKCKIDMEQNFIFARDMLDDISADAKFNCSWAIKNLLSEWNIMNRSRRKS